ncbi:DUF4336 domain-containing protein [Lusitaniella coriacea LEGE 07157]|uniref:DUF4336 domain-containing protein n=1 Tax=Lusitaniella coriacea LEGE 07157 TaxID=945747 RepID=A0A8J7ITN2_9CYAN|nr:DUF4336 domain-containing protein [Lusitaniella coriacea]MBE9116972.1 DUF4336 domain-containing protein [Lusitaniella coriacea LEGE 07157]
MLREIDRDIWVAEQPFNYLGLNVGTRMTVIRCANRELAVISPIQVDDAIVHQLNSLGTVCHIIAPNRFHYLFATHFKTVYPKATFWATSSLKAKNPELPIDRVLSNETNNILNGIECFLFEGVKALTLSGVNSLDEWVFFHPESRTLVVTDIAFHFDQSFPLISQFAARMLGSYKTLSPSFLEKIATQEKEKVKESVQKISTWDFDRVIMAHGTIVQTKGKPQFIEGYERFLGSSVKEKT